MYKDLNLYIENARSSKNADGMDFDPTKLDVYYNKFTKHFDNLYEFVRENYSLIIRMQKELGIDEKQFIDIMGDILSEAANIKDTLEKIINTK